MIVKPDGIQAATQTVDPRYAALNAETHAVYLLDLGNFEVRKTESLKFQSYWQELQLVQAEIRQIQKNLPPRAAGDDVIRVDAGLSPELSSRASRLGTLVNTYLIVAAQQSYKPEVLSALNNLFGKADDDLKALILAALSQGIDWLPYQEHYADPNGGYQAVDRWLASLLQTLPAGRVKDAAKESFLALRPIKDPEKLAVIDSLWNGFTKYEQEKVLENISPASSAGLDFLTNKLNTPAFQATIKHTLQRYDSAANPEVHSAIRAKRLSPSFYSPVRLSPQATTPTANYPLVVARRTTLVSGKKDNSSQYLAQVTAPYGQFCPNGGPELYKKSLSKSVHFGQAGAGWEGGYRFSFEHSLIQATEDDTVPGLKIPIHMSVSQGAPADAAERYDNPINSGFKLTKISRFKGSSGNTGYPHDDTAGYNGPDGCLEIAPNQPQCSYGPNEPLIRLPGTGGPVGTVEGNFCHTVISLETVLLGKSASCDAYIIPYDNALRATFEIGVDDFGTNVGSSNSNGEKLIETLNFPADADQDGLPDEYEDWVKQWPGNTFLPLNACSSVSDPLHPVNDSRWDYDVSTREWANRPQDQGWTQEAKGNGITVWETYRGFLDNDSGVIVRGGRDYRLPESWAGNFDELGLERHVGYDIYSRVYWTPFVKTAFLNSETGIVNRRYEHYDVFGSEPLGPQTFAKWLGFYPRWIGNDMYDPWARGQTAFNGFGMIGNLGGGINFTSAQDPHAQSLQQEQASIKLRDLTESEIRQIGNPLAVTFIGRSGTNEVNDYRVGPTQVLGLPIGFLPDNIRAFNENISNVFPLFNYLEDNRVMTVHELWHKTTGMHDHDSMDDPYAGPPAIPYQNLSEYINRAVTQNRIDETLFYPIMQQISQNDYVLLLGHWAKIEALGTLSDHYFFDSWRPSRSESLPFIILDTFDIAHLIGTKEAFIPEIYRQSGRRGYAFIAIKLLDHYPTADPPDRFGSQQKFPSGALLPITGRAGFYSSQLSFSVFAPELMEQRQDVYQRVDLKR